MRTTAIRPPRLVSRLADRFAGDTRVQVSPRKLAAIVRSAAPAHSPESLPRWVLIPAGLMPILLIFSWAIADVRQPADYNPIRDTISVAAGYGGTDRWIMTGALFVIGGCYLVTAAGFAAVGLPARIGLAVTGLAGIGIAAFPEPAHGATTPHAVFTALGAAALAVWPALVARWQRPSFSIFGVRGSTAATTFFLILLAWLTLETQHGALLGLAERLSSSIWVTWPFVVGFAAYHRTRVHALIRADSLRASLRQVTQLPEA
ncbi:MAG TPA: DUF998 domain-containing protein [Jatrophihabitantaceae bacterium]|jgi:hypothetical protein|nr:DUF998 domain-containing protein [Jatrophihabitantaceae bacterium]